MEIWGMVYGIVLPTLYTSIYATFPLQLLEKDMPSGTVADPRSIKLKTTSTQVMFVAFKHVIFNIIVYRCIPQKLRNHSRVTGVINQPSYPKSDTYSL